ncbi:MAG TPA: GTP 3',8-cyclase MoaA [Halanaerobiales bacterium]|nr:GTP 3',8-cyclase MoaA [Halanaerobiales bacterium]
MEKLVDNWGRKINYLRISVTDRCNLRCKYCMPEEGIETKSHEDILSYEQIIKIVKIGKELGIKNVRITGGEPLVRLNLVELIGSLNKLNLNDISLTTNGVLLAEKAKKLKKAGIDRVNISLDSLKKDKYKEITRRDQYDKVIAGIEAALKYELNPVKLNMVVMKGINDDELIEFAKLSIDKPLHVRFIEYMPLGNDINGAEYYEMKKVKKKIENKFELIKAETEGNGPARYFKISGSKGSIGFISPMSEHFCAECNRFRLTADGKFRPCLARDLEVEIPKDFNRESIIKAYQEALSIKPISHDLNFADNNDRDRTMSQIGG